MLTLMMLVACSGGEPAPDHLPRGSWTLEGEGFTGVLSSDGAQCSIGIWGPTWRTGGAEPVRCDVQHEGEQTWLYFVFEGGAGEGDAAAWLEADALHLPLGARPGEWTLTLARAPGGIEAPLREGLARRAEEGIAAELQGWAQGMFTLWEGEQPVGELSLPAGALPELAVFDAFWMSDGVEVPDLASHGPDLILTFPVMPSFGDDIGLLRVNRVLREAVVPMGPEPTPDDRRLALRFGTLDPAQREAARARAVAQANAKERELGIKLAGELVLAATEAAGEGPCPPLGALEPRWGFVLRGYGVELARGASGACEVTLEPKPPQHRRRWSARVGPEGVLEERFVE